MLGYLQQLPEQILVAQDELDDRFCRAMTARDIDAAMSCFSNDPNLVLVLWGNVVRGPDALRAALLQLFDDYPSVRLEINDCSHIPAGDAVIAVGTATYTLRNREGAESRLIERWTDLRRQVDGRWVYVLDHATTVPE